MSGAGERLTYAQFMRRFMKGEGTHRGDHEEPFRLWNETEELRFREMISKALRTKGVGGLLALGRDLGFGVTGVTVPEGQVHHPFRKDQSYTIWSPSETKRQLERLGKISPAPAPDTPCVFYIDERLLPPGNGEWRTCRALVGVHNAVLPKADKLRVVLTIMVRN